MTKVVNIHHRLPYNIYVGRGRGSIWGNPYSHMPDTLAQYKVATRQEAVDKYAQWIQTQPELLHRLIQLKGQTLGCWCVPAACHATILAQMADALPEPDLDITWE